MPYNFRMLERYRAWRHRQKERRIAQWAVKRKRGKSYFVSGVALFYCLLYSSIFGAVDYLSRDDYDIAKFTFSLVYFFLGRLLLGNIQWNSREKEYLKAESEVVTAN